MESRIYSALLHFNYGIDRPLAALDTLERMDLEPPEYIQQIRVRFREVAANANSHFTDRVSKQEIRKQLECERNTASKRRKRILTASTCAWQRRKTFAAPGLASSRGNSALDKT